MTLMKYISAWLLILTLLGREGRAQQLPGRRDSLQSTSLKQNMTFRVILPTQYKPGAADRYDVLYVLDGDYNTKLVLPLQAFLEAEQKMPPTIIVSVYSSDRNRDFLPTAVAEYPNSGGADLFLNFLANELLPYINTHYPATGDNTLLGHSFGGLFTTYALLKRPTLFKSYLAIDPSYWYDHDFLLKLTADKVAGLTNSQTTFFVSGKGETGMRVPDMERLLSTRAPKELIWQVMTYPNETHSSVRLKSIYDGLKFSYGGYKSYLQVYPEIGILLKEKPIHLWYFGDTTRVRYTLDGTPPTLSSPRVSPEIELNQGANVLIKHFTNRSRYDHTIGGSFSTEDYLPASKRIRSLSPGGFDYAYYEGDWDQLPDFTRLTPVKIGRVDSTFSLDKLPRQAKFGLVLSGQLEVREEGYYLFVADSDDGSRFYLAHRLLAEFAGIQPMEHPNKSFMVPLQKGFYPVRIEYFQKEGDRKLMLEYILPSSMASKQTVPIPLDLQYGTR
ncbi:alpha/beta hydrolase-fold protein [Spirosoma pomorum]